MAGSESIIALPPSLTAGGRHKRTLESYRQQVATAMAKRQAWQRVGLCNICGAEREDASRKACASCREFARNKKAALRIHKQQTNTPKTTV